MEQSVLTIALNLLNFLLTLYIPQCVAFPQWPQYKRKDLYYTSNLIMVFTWSSPCLRAQVCGLNVRNPTWRPKKCGFFKKKLKVLCFYRYTCFTLRVLSFILFVYTHYCSNMPKKKTGARKKAEKQRERQKGIKNSKQMRDIVELPCNLQMVGVYLSAWWCTKWFRSCFP